MTHIWVVRRQTVNIVIVLTQSLENYQNSHVVFIAIST